MILSFCPRASTCPYSWRNWS